MLGATPDGAADAALLQLVVSSRLPVHLICDATHRLLAASRPRAQAWQVSPESLHGLSLWRYASEDIQHAERQLADLGWYEPAAAPVILSTGANRYAEVPIRPSQVRWTRLRLSDGSYARLVETMHSGSEPE
ncbi:hypothetical protein SAMN02745126_06284 [Enhydrobacter aerosaccus]|uniref:Uncharacterized protein n=2 Tax=Enhydrobacter aerosaccus TaxID=225324 RepID=A0A1T4THK1_9HYPH|nr:hypothetical protein SAMN02745126_06284 [Enhydrobacter aerosaccus]